MKPESLLLVLVQLWLLGCTQVWVKGGVCLWGGVIVLAQSVS
jgi:hypothetical protein